MLQDTKGFCCLGVLADLHAKINPEEALPWVEVREGGTTADGYYTENVVGFKYGREAELPPDVVMAWAFENYEEGHDKCVRVAGKGGIPGTLAETLAGLNDAGKTFEEIADEIEVKL